MKKKINEKEILMKELFNDV